MGQSSCRGATRSSPGSRRPPRSTRPPYARSPYAISFVGLAVGGVVAVEIEAPVLVHEHGPRHRETHAADPEVADPNRLGNAGQPPPTRRPLAPFGRSHAVLFVAEPAIEGRHDPPPPPHPFAH